MIRSELIEIIATENPHLTPQEAERAVVSVFTEIIAALEAGGRAELRGFGVFTVREREAREGRNPATGEKVEVKPKHVAFFKTGKHLHKRLNGDA